MNSVDPGSLLLQLGQQPSAAPQSAGISDQQILALASRGASMAEQPSDNTQNAQLAASVTPQGGNRFSTWMKNAPAAAGGELYRMYKGVTGQPMDPLARAVMQSAQQASPGVATATDMLATAPAMMGAEAAAPALGLARLAANPAAMGAIQGGIQGLLTADPGQHIQQGLLGAAGGGVLGGAMGGLGKLASGLSRTPDAQTLLSKGVTLPPGMLNSHGPASAIEQALTHIPGVGSRIGNARGAVPSQITDLMTQDAVAPGQALPKGLGINDAVDQLQNGYDAAYGNAVGGYPASAKIMRTTGSDIPLSDAFDSVANKARQGLTADARAKMGQTLQDQLQEVINAARQSGNGLQATDLQAFRSTLRTLGREAPEGTTQGAVRGFWQDAEDKVTQALESQLPPKAAAQLRATDAQYGKFATTRDLAASVKDRTPTVNDWSNAVARNTPKPVYAAGGGWNRDLINAAAKVVKPTVAHTGALGAGTIAPIAGAAAAGMEGLMHPGALMAHPVAAAGTAGLLGSLYGAYSKTGMKALAGQTGAQKAIQGLLSTLNPSLKQGLSLGARALPLQGLLQAPPQ